MINLVVRFNNPIFIIELISSIVMPIMGYYQIRGEEITSWGKFYEIIKKTLSNPYIIGIIIVNIISTLTDPTTKGLGDSERALKYIYPN